MATVPRLSAKLLELFSSCLDDLAAYERVFGQFLDELMLEGGVLSHDGKQLFL